ncbi:alpha/beta family hydrolase [Nocardioides sp. REDSEA-S30_B4]|uniref:alpha/beta hydrolase family protein n=1 Tax=Nocardioides sp. REDSEA-S30_B4 TaxID=1811552 RepID=UPI000AC6C7CF|nr:alpha/beta family hydrolase [Nocardioides sp. REDSEA-S30_B4]
MSATEKIVETPHGPGRLVVQRARKASATLLLSHGAGVGIDTRDLEALAADLPRQGFTVARFEQPWRHGCLALAFPLHPPGKPEKSRLAELEGSGVPTLVVQGERDTMGRPEEFPDPLPDHVHLAVVPGADHGFKVPKRGDLTEDDAMALLVEATLEWLVREVLTD